MLLNRNKALQFFDHKQVHVDGRNLRLVDWLKDTLVDDPQYKDNPHNSHYHFINTLLYVKQQQMKDNLIYVCDPIKKLVFENREQLHKIVLEDWIKESSGAILLDDDCIMLYYFEKPKDPTIHPEEDCHGMGAMCLIDKNGQLVDAVCVSSRLEWEGDGERKIMWDTPKYYHEQERNTQFATDVYYPHILALAFMQYAKTETIILENGQKKPFNGEKIVNSTGLKVRYIDSRWVREIIRTEGFKVRGHFRMQAKGKGRAERELIYISPYEKHGYHRRALKDI